jgi:RecA/RadA recombinase
VLDQPALSTGFPRLDAALGTGGLPRGTLIQAVAQGTAGLTTLALTVLTHAQRNREATAWIDTPLTFDAEYAVSRGVQLEKLLVVRSANYLSEVLYTLVSSRGTGLVVCDLRNSATQLPTATSWTQIATAAATTETTLLLLSENRANLLVYPAALRLQLRQERWLRRGADVRGVRVQVEVLKNRYAPAGRCVSLTIGFHTRQGVLDL